MNVQGVTDGATPKLVYAYRRVRQHRPVCLTPKTRDYLAGNHLPLCGLVHFPHTCVARGRVGYVSVGDFCDHEHGSPTAA